MTQTTVSLIVSRLTVRMYCSHIYLSDRKSVIAYEKDLIIRLLTKTAYLNDQDYLIRMLYKDSYWLFQSTTLTFSTFPFLHLHLNFVLFSFIVLVAFVNFKETNMMMMTSYLCNEHIHMASSKRHCFYIISFVCMCVVSVEVRNWKPIPIDSITDDFSATVEQILGSLASFITIRIRLTRWIITHFCIRTMV